MTASSPAPDLTAADIPFSATGLSHGIVHDPVDAATYRELLHAALSLAAERTREARQAARVSAQLRDDLRAGRAPR